MQEWIDIKKELPNIGQMTALKIIDTKIYKFVYNDNDSSYFKKLPGKTKEHIRLGWLVSSKIWEISHYTKEFNCILRFNQVSHWQREIREKDIINNRFEILDL